MLLKMLLHSFPFARVSNTELHHTALWLRVGSFKKQHTFMTLFAYTFIGELHFPVTLVPLSPSSGTRHDSRNVVTLTRTHTHKIRFFFVDVVVAAAVGSGRFQNKDHFLGPFPTFTTEAKKQKPAWDLWCGGAAAAAASHTTATTTQSYGCCFIGSSSSSSPSKSASTARTQLSSSPALVFLLPPRPMKIGTIFVSPRGAAPPPRRIFPNHTAVGKIDILSVPRGPLPLCSTGNSL